MKHGESDFKNEYRDKLQKRYLNCIELEKLQNQYQALTEKSYRNEFLDTIDQKYKRESFILPDISNQDNDGPRVRFEPYDEPPRPLSNIINFIVYPDIAREAQIEGTVIVQAYIDDIGTVSDWVIMRGIPNTGLDEAAITAVRKTLFKPAKQGDRYVGVWIAIPIVFKLK